MLMGAALGWMAVQFLGLKGGPILAPEFTVYQLFGYLTLFISIVLILRVVIAVAHDRLGWLPWHAL